MPSNKAPGSDGYTSEFFIAGWPILGMDFTTAVQSFFTHGHMPQGVNATKLVLVPKKPDAAAMKDYRPISCCNTIYKVISKLLANRLKELLPEAIEKNQCAFVKGRLLLENVLLATELVKDYHKPHSSARCLLKLDITKAFDTISWEFIAATLHTMDIPVQFISWIQECIQSATFSISINGEMEGFFSSSRGLRQGCPLSPYLFVIALNVLSLSLTKASIDGKIGYHPCCKDMKLNHLSFADDIMIFTDGTSESISETLEILKEFGKTSGLYINAAKSAIYTPEGSHQSVQHAAQNLGIPLEKLPIRYLGLPLTTKNMTRSDYEPLIDMVRSRLLSWTSKFLSYAGRLQLIQSVIKSITNFWCSVFRLPNRCFHVIDSMCSAFLWSGSPNTNSKAKISWKEVCKPKEEGGLGIRKMHDTSKTFSLSLIWRLLENTKSLWASWSHCFLLRHSSFWDAKPSSRGSWIWNKLLKLKSQAQSFVRWEVNSGNHTSFWLDNWIGTGRLIDTLGDSGIRNLGIQRSATVSEAASCHGWTFRRCRLPHVRDIISQIENIPHPNPNAGKDIVLWKHDDMDFKPWFSSKRTWHQIREKEQRVPWYKVVWFSLSSPRHAFITWLAVKNRLSTGDRMRIWGQEHACQLCGERNETREHLFFACPYSFTIWNSLTKNFCVRPNPDWHISLSSLIRNRLTPIDHTIVCMLFQTTIYHVWRERNTRIHHQRSRTVAYMITNIKKEITNRLLSQSDERMITLQQRWFSISRN